MNDIETTAWARFEDQLAQIDQDYDARCGQIDMAFEDGTYDTVDTYCAARDMAQAQWIRLQENAEYTYHNAIGDVGWAA